MLDHLLPRRLSGTNSSAATLLPSARRKNHQTLCRIIHPVFRKRNTSSLSLLTTRKLIPRCKHHWKLVSQTQMYSIYAVISSAWEKLTNYADMSRWRKMSRSPEWTAWNSSWGRFSMGNRTHSWRRPLWRSLFYVKAKNTSRSRPLKIFSILFRYRT